MDFAAKLNSTSVRDQSYAACFLRSEGTKGLKYLPLLLEKCQAINSSQALDRYEVALLGLGATTLAALVVESGFDDTDPLHDRIVCWIAETTQAVNITVAANSVYALGKLGHESLAARECLGSIIVSDLRGDEHEHVSLRAIALRLVRRIAPSLSATFVDAPAFAEYAHAVDHWKATETSKDATTRMELKEEYDWLVEVKNR